MADAAKPILEREDNVEEAWDVEIRRRVVEADAGRARAVPAEEVFVKTARLLAKHRKD